MKKSKLDTWLTRTANRCGIEGGQGRSGAATLFAALVVCNGIGILAAIGLFALLAKTFGLLQ